MRFCSLGSGSSGNAHIVESGETTLLIDCGFSRRRLLSRLDARRISVAELDAVIISHEHGDHAAGLDALAAEAKLPVYMSAGTARALAFAAPWRRLSANQTLTIGELSVLSVPVPHDVAEPLQFVIESGARRLALFTDLGHASAAVRRACVDLDALVVECNYDEEMLSRGKYPEHIKRRIAGDFGHLSNAAAAELARETKGSRRRNIIAAHISKENNRPELAINALSAADRDALVSVATQEEGTDWLTI